MRIEDQTPTVPGKRTKKTKFIALPPLDSALANIQYALKSMQLNIHNELKVESLRYISGFVLDMAASGMIQRNTAMNIGYMLHDMIRLVTATQCSYISAKAKEPAATTLLIKNMLKTLQQSASEHKEFATLEFICCSTSSHITDGSTYDNGYADSFLETLADMNKLLIGVSGIENRESFDEAIKFLNHDN